MIRPERPADADSIRQVHREAFAGPAEADLVDRLRERGYGVLSLVATDKTLIVGHIYFSRLRIETPERLLPAVALAPMGVLPAYQRQGIGTALISAGLAACRRAGETIAVVVGHREYYPRFGFSPALARPLSSPYSGESSMALELQPGALQGVNGTLVYAPPFDEL